MKQSNHAASKKNIPLNTMRSLETFPSLSGGASKNNNSSHNIHENSIMNVTFGSTAKNQSLL